jgi:hypothetical protein
MCGALSLAVVAIAPTEAQAQKSQRPVAKKKRPAAPTKKPGATRPSAADTGPTSTPTTQQPATAEPDPYKPATGQPTGSDENNEDAKSASKSAEPTKGEDESKAPVGPPPIAIDVALGLRAFQRHLSYSSDAEAVKMRPYDIDPGAAAIMAAAEIFPGAPFTTGPGADIGITASLQTAVGLKSKYKNPLNPNEPNSYTTKSYGFEFGMKYRFRFGTSEVAIAAAYGQQVFSLNLPDQNQTAAGLAVPAAEYSYVRPGLSARFGISDGFAISTGLGYLLVLGAGEMTSSDFFPHASVGGADIDIGVAIELTKHLEVRPSFNYRAFFYSMNYAAGAGDRFNVGGALDQYLGLNLLLAYRN